MPNSGTQSPAARGERRAELPVRAAAARRPRPRFPTRLSSSSRPQQAATSPGGPRGSTWLPCLILSARGGKVACRSGWRCGMIPWSAELRQRDNDVHRIGYVHTYRPSVMCHIGMIWCHASHGVHMNIKKNTTATTAKRQTQRKNKEKGYTRYQIRTYVPVRV